MMKVTSLFFITLLLLSFGCFASASNRATSDISNPILSSRSDYTPLLGDDDIEEGSGIVPGSSESRAWTVPRGQFDVGVVIYGIIFGFMTSWGQDDPISLLARSIYVMSFLVCVQVYFGFYISVQKRGGSCCLISYIPEFKYNRVEFGRNGMEVSFGRWVSGPFSWIWEVLSYLPAEYYTFLMEKAYFPNRSIIHLIFMVQLLYFFGLYDCYRSNIVPPP